MLHSSSVRPISREGRLPRGPCAYRYCGTGAGLLIQQEGSAVGVGGFIFLEIKADVPPVVAVKVSGEFACLQVDKAGEKYHKWTGEIGINVSIFMIISIKFAANVSDEKKVT